MFSGKVKTNTEKKKKKNLKCHLVLKFFQLQISGGWIKILSLIYEGLIKHQTQATHIEILSFINKYTDFMKHIDFMKHLDFMKRIDL